MTWHSLHHVWHMMWFFGTSAVPFRLLTFLFPSFWYKFILVLSIQRVWFQNLGDFSQVFLAKSNLTFLFLNISSGLHLVLKPLYITFKKASLYFRLWLPAPACSWLTPLLWRGFSSPRTGIYHHLVVFRGLLWSSRPFDVVCLLISDRFILFFSAQGWAPSLALTSPWTSYW